jgi:mono/diheme cytochrome c family protein
VGKGQALYPEQNCDSCHEMEPGKDSDAPNLFRRGTLEYIVKIIEDASRPELYGERSKMPKFGQQAQPRADRGSGPLRAQPAQVSA